MFNNVLIRKTYDETENKFKICQNYLKLSL